MLPTDLLHELPIARDWDDIDRVARENETIRVEINALVGEKWKKLALGTKKSYIKEFIFKKPDILRRVINEYNATVVEPYDIYKNMDYLIEKTIHKIIKEQGSFNIVKKNSKTHLMHH